MVNPYKLDDGILIIDMFGLHKMFLYYTTTFILLGELFFFLVGLLVFL